jgi:cysteine synthase A
VSRKDLHVFESPIELMEGMWPTPLLRLSIGSKVWAKLEFYNPFSRSIKDRTALFLFREALLKGYKRITDATSGNTGIALASLSAIYGIEFIAFLPIVAPKVFKTFMKILGTKVIEIGNSTTEILPLVKQFVKNNEIIHIDQFTNELNVISHFETTAKEIDMQLSMIDLKPERIIASMGTAGHIAGISKYFKQKYGDNVEIIGVQPAEGERIPGIKRQDVKENVFLRNSKIDRIIEVNFTESIDGIMKVARTSGILVGFSGGACIAAYEKLKSYDDRVTVIIIPDDLYKYAYEIVEMEEEILKRISS